MVEQDYMEEDPLAAAPSGETPDAESTEDAEDEASATQTALVPKGVFMGKVPAVGDTVKFKVSGIFEDEIEVVCQRDEAELAAPEPVAAPVADPLME